MAKDGAWLLSQSSLTLDNGELRNRYYNLLLKRGYAYYNGRIRITKLLSDFTKFYSRKFLNSIHCPINSIERGWVIRLLLKDKVEVVQPPLRHLLLLTFLECTAEQIFTTFTEFKPFGDGPWPCLNHAADHFNDLTIMECHITDCLIKNKRGRPMGTFSCKCGFAYNRIGPDDSTDDRLRLDSVQSYGHVWERALQKLWANITIPLQEASINLGVSELTVVRHAIRLELPMNTPETRQAHGYERYKTYRKTMQEAREQYRKEWLIVLKENPKARRKQLIAIASFLYMWLRKNDLEWIEKHLPPIVRPKRGIKRIDWKTEDRKLSIAVKDSANRIKNLPGHPVRASITVVTKETGHRAWVERRLKDLPLTARAIKKHVESLEAYTIRKVRWAETQFRQERKSPTRSQLMRRAVVVNKTGNTHQVQKEIDAALARFNTTIS